LELFANGSANSPSWLVNVNRNEAQARYLANDSDNAEQLIRTVVGRLSDPQNFQYAGTMWENVATNGTPGLTKQTSLAHGWATGAVSALSGYVLGIRPTAPGYENWLVQPHPGTLSWAVGQAPTPFGPLSVKWGGQRGSSFSMEVSAPASTTGTISIPANGVTNPTISMNGNVVWRNGKFISGSGPSNAAIDGQFINLNGIQPGTYTLGVSPG
jgi:alpha-L-rhamnosidase